MIGQYEWQTKRLPLLSFELESGKYFNNEAYFINYNSVLYSIRVQYSDLSRIGALIVEGRSFSRRPDVLPRGLDLFPQRYLDPNCRMQDHRSAKNEKHMILYKSIPLLWVVFS